ncbi:MAG: hypothetical protein J6N18_01875, partial [Kiritimatiellae bacterium]|nr:hypothetical protein [Kiritimatiellia bacterium]
MLALLLLAVAGCASSDVVSTSRTDFAEKALAQYVEKGELPGAISVFYKDGVQEVACVGYADVEKKRPITLDNVFM